MMCVFYVRTKFRTNIIFSMSSIDNFTNNFFVFLCESYDILATSRKYRSIGSWERALDGMRHKEMFDQLKAKKALYNLKKKSWIKDRKKGEEIEFRLTDKGEQALLKIKMSENQKKLPFDQLCIVVFDFPVGANNARDKFRRLLKQIGCSKYQDSVWGTDKDIVDYLRSLMSRMKLDNWVRVFVGQEAV